MNKLTDTLWWVVMLAILSFSVYSCAVATTGEEGQPSIRTHVEMAM